jgi:DNA-binding transcriptional LysR family regulator
MEDRDGKKHQLELSARILANNGDFLLSAAEAGLGICISPTFIAYRSILAGRLTPILTHYQIADTTAYAVYPSRRFVPLRVRALAKHLQEAFGDQPYWDEELEKARPRSNAPPVNA